jgi:hypothetical protein
VPATMDKAAKIPKFKKVRREAGVEDAEEGGEVQPRKRKSKKVKEGGKSRRKERRGSVGAEEEESVPVYDENTRGSTAHGDGSVLTVRTADGSRGAYRQYWQECSRSAAEAQGR